MKEYKHQKLTLNMEQLEELLSELNDRYEDGSSLVEHGYRIEIYGRESYTLYDYGQGHEVMDFSTVKGAIVYIKQLLKQTEQ